VFRNWFGPSRPCRADRRSPAHRWRPVLETLEDRWTPTQLPNGFAESLVAGGLGSPTAMTAAPDGRVFITTQVGDLRVVKNGALLATPFVHLTVDSNGERGLLGVAFDPNFASNQFVYLYYTVPGTGVHNRVSRFTASGDVAVAGSEKVILDLNPLSSATNHNGGAIHFGLDGMLYIDVGENANAANSQTLNNLLGKTLRIDVSQITASDPPNSDKLIPPDNPFVTQATGINRAIYALGLRNPFTFAVQPGTGTIFINDVGQSTWEEINRLVPGSNYGWNLSEGFANPNPPSGLGPGTYRDPLLSYNHSGGPAGGGIAIVGGVFYNPPGGATNLFPAAYSGKYFYADLGGNWIRVFDPANTGSLANPDTSTGFATSTVGNPVDLLQAPDGGLYYLARGSGGELLKISFNGTAPTVAGVAVNAGAAQRSRVTTLAVTFDQTVTLAPGAFTLTRVGLPNGGAGDNATVGTITVSTQTINGATVATLTFAGANTTAGSLNDGNWTLTVDHTKVQSAVGAVGMVANFTQANIKRLYGDVNGDGKVDNADYFQLRSTFGLSTGQAGFLAAFDADGNGVIDNADYFQFRARFGATI
jgi:glucose/arabinose dehydrogenase